MALEETTVSHLFSHCIYDLNHGIGIGSQYGIGKILSLINSGIAYVTSFMIFRKVLGMALEENTFIIYLVTACTMSVLNNGIGMGLQNGFEKLLTAIYSVIDYNNTIMQPF